MTLSIKDESATHTRNTGVEINEALIWGPPGCGKTTYVSRQVAKAAEKYGGNAVLVASFTKAAATELGMKNLPVPGDHVGTLHAHCFRALEYPEIAETRISDWNKECPQFRLSASSDDVDERELEITIRTHGDELYAKLGILRARMEPVERWPTVVCRFATAWSEWKRSRRLLDFTDLLEIGLSDFRIAPGNPKVLFVDEAQDLSRLQLALVRQWGRHLDHLVLAGDDDQAILTFAGSDPEALLEKNGPEFFRHVLSQSYRVPRTVHALSQAWIQNLSFREPKEYKPRDHEGEIRLFHRGNYRSPTAVVDDAEHYIEMGKQVMFLSTCSYMLEPLKRLLRQRGLPFFNPYRRKRLDWNPLRAEVRGASPADRLSSFLKPRPESLGYEWVGEDVRRWASWLRAESILRDGAMDAIKKLSPTQTVTVELLERLFEDEALKHLAEVAFDAPLDGYIQWWLNSLIVKKRKLCDYPARVVMRHGVEALTLTPRIIIGTGHSVKGGEADVVYMFPDLSASGTRQWEGSRKDRDAVIRLGYVMMTRARETLVICEPAGSEYMPLANAVAKVARERFELSR